MTDYNRGNHKDMLSLSNILQDAKIENETYVNRIKQIKQAYEACNRNNVPIGERLSKMVDIYQAIKGVNAISHTDCPETDGVEIFALILDGINGLDTSKLGDCDLALAGHYKNFKKSEQDLDEEDRKFLPILRKYLEPELEKHIQNYNIKNCSSPL
jgi:hypothetical protein